MSRSHGTLWYAALSRERFTLSYALDRWDRIPQRVTPLGMTRRIGREHDRFIDEARVGRAER